jgi:sirohydrochlorin ferrochelatase
MKEGIIILGHGSRREDANAEIRQFAQLLQEKNPKTDYQVAFLEFAEPSLNNAVAKLLQNSKLEKVIIMPLFLTMGTHIYRNIPDKILKIKADYPKIKFALAPHLGLDYRMMEIVQDRVKCAEELNDIREDSK